MPDQKTMRTRCLGGFSVMWVTKLLISPVKKGFFAQKPPNLARIWHFWPLLAHSVPCWWVGWWLWRGLYLARHRFTLFYWLSFLLISTPEWESKNNVMMCFSSKVLPLEKTVRIFCNKRTPLYKRFPDGRTLPVGNKSKMENIAAFSYHTRDPISCASSDQKNIHWRKSEERIHVKSMNSMMQFQNPISTQMIFTLDNQ